MTVAPGGSPITEDAGAVGVDVAAIDGAVAVEGRSPWQIVRMRLRRDKVTMVALVITILLILMAIAGAGHRGCWGSDPYTGHIELVQGLGSIPDGAFGGISGSHPLGVEPGHGPRPAVPHPLRHHDLAAGRHPRHDLRRRPRHRPRHHRRLLPRCASTGDQPVHGPRSSLPADPDAAVAARVLLDRMAASAHVPPPRQPRPRSAASSVVLGFFGWPVLRPHHPRAGALPARARVRRGGPVPGRQAPGASTSRRSCPTCGRRSSSTPR